MQDRFLARASWSGMARLAGKNLGYEVVWTFEHVIVPEASVRVIRTAQPASWPWTGTPSSSIR